MLRFTLLFLLPLLISVTAQDGYNQNLRRQRPVPTLGRPRPIRPVAVVTQPPVTAATQPPVVVITQPPAVAGTPSPEVVSAPQVIIQLVGGSQTPATTAPQSPSGVVQPEAVSPLAATDRQPLDSAVLSPTQTEATQVPIEPKEEIVAYEPNLEPQPELEVEPALESKPEPEVAPEPELEPQPQIQSEKPQMSYLAVQAAPLKPVIKPAPAVLPPLLPKQQPVRESVFGRQTRPITQVPITVSTQRVTKAPPVIITTSTQKPGSMKLDLVCKDGNGYYAVDNECDAFIECKYNKATQHWCPDGLHFNPAAKRYEYPCAYPSLVQCTAGRERQNPNPTAQCPRQYGFYSTHDEDCSKYIVCQEGAATVMDCPPGLVFNPTVQSCDWVENVPQCNPNVFKDYICPEPPIDEDGLMSDIIYRYRYEKHCKLYIACHRGYPRLLSCEDGLSFHEDYQSCVEEEYVQDCAVQRS